MHQVRAILGDQRPGAASERMTDQVDGVEVQVVAQTGDVGGELAEQVRPGSGATSVPAQVDRDDPASGGVTTSAHFRADLLVAEWNVAGMVGKLLRKPLVTDETRVTAWLDRYAEASGTALSEEQLNILRQRHLEAWLAEERAAAEVVVHVEDLNASPATAAP